MIGRRAPQHDLAWIIWLLIAAAVGAGCTTADNSLERVQRQNTLRVGLDPTYPPFENGDTGELHGLDVDLAREIAAELGVETEFVYYGYDGLYDALLTGQIDLLLSALAIDISRTKDFSYSQPYFNAGQYLVIHQDSKTDIREMSDLDRRLLAVELGSEGHLQALQWQKRLASLEVMTLPTADDAMWLVLQEEADAALVDQVSGRLYRRQFPALDLISEPVTVEPYALVLRTEDRALLAAIDDILDTLIADGRLDKIAGRWLD